MLALDSLESEEQISPKEFSGRLRKMRNCGCEFSMINEESFSCI